MKFICRYLNYKALFFLSLTTKSNLTICLEDISSFGLVSVRGSRKGLISNIMVNVKNKYLHIQKSDSRPVALHIIADALPVAVQDRLA